MERLVYYAIDANPTYRSLVRRSIASLRRFNAEVPVRVLVFGPRDPAFLAWCAGQAVRVTHHREPATMKKTFLKWAALARHPAERVLFADADTIFFGDPDLLFDRYREADFYARLELNTDATGPVRLGKTVFQPQIDHAALGALFAAAGRRATPIFNTGVMLFNAGADAWIASRLADFRRLERLFRDGGLPYPSTNRHIAEEIVTALALGGIEGLTTGALAAADAPMYLELREGAVPGPGIVLHVWTSLYNEFLGDCLDGKYDLAG